MPRVSQEEGSGAWCWTRVQLQSLQSSPGQNQLKINGFYLLIPWPAPSQLVGDHWDDLWIIKTHNQKTHPQSIPEHFLHAEQPRDTAVAQCRPQRLSLGFLSSPTSAPVSFPSRWLNVWPPSSQSTKRTVRPSWLLLGWGTIPVCRLTFIPALLFHVFMLLSCQTLVFQFCFFSYWTLKCYVDT